MDNYASTDKVNGIGSTEQEITWLNKKTRLNLFRDYAGFAFLIVENLPGNSTNFENSYFLIRGWSPFGLEALSCLDS